jgi:hypothetical protein
MLNPEAFEKLLNGVGVGIAGAFAYMFRQIMQQNSKLVDIAKEVGKAQGDKEGVEKLSRDVVRSVDRLHDKLDKNECKFDKEKNE